MVVQTSKQHGDGWWRSTPPNAAIEKIEDCLLYKEFAAAGVQSFSDVFEHTAQKYKDKDCLGTRQVILKHTMVSQGKTIDKLELGDYQWTTYTQMNETSKAVGLALKEMGYKLGDRIAIFAETRAEWLMASAGIASQRISTCTLYTTLSDVGVIHALNETEVQLIFTSYDLLQRIIGFIDQCPLVKTIVVMEDQVDGVGDLKTIPKNIETIPFRSLVHRGKQCPTGVLNKPQLTDIAIVMYTSGSTGTPKGVEITNSNVLAFIYAYYDKVSFDSTSRYLAFLPLAHIMELVTELALMACGIKVFYSSPATLTSSSFKIHPGTDGDAKVAKPTLMNCVPLVLDKVIKSVTQKVEQQGWLKSFVFKKLVNYKLWIDYIPLTSSILDLLVFRKVKIELGGELQTLVVGGAPLSIQTQDKFRAMFGCDIKVGYGSTETTACATAMAKDDHKSGTTGTPNIGVLIKLTNWDEGGYKVTDKPNPRGEVIIAGPSIAKGYFKRPEETAAAFFEENGQWCFRTGDIGEMDEFGCLKIIDRLKDLVKMKHGEYVSLGNTESVLKTMPLVDNVCVFADSLQERVVAVVVPVADELLKLGKQESVTALTNPSMVNMSHLYSNRHLIKLVLTQLQEYSKQCSLNKWETPAAIILTSDVWNPETGLVTAALKLRRKQLMQRYGTQVQALYKTLVQTF